MTLLLEVYREGRVGLKTVHWINSLHPGRRTRVLMPRIHTMEGQVHGIPCNQSPD